MNQLEYQSFSTKRKGIGLLPWLSLATSIAAWCLILSFGRMSVSQIIVFRWVMLALLVSSIIAAIMGIIVSIIKRRSLVAFSIAGLALLLSLLPLAFYLLVSVSLYLDPHHGPGPSYY